MVPFFSICIPNFNYGDYIGDTIKSVLSQDFTDFEVIVVDNASTDNSWEVIRGFAASDPRIKPFRNNFNVGFAPNLQKASEKAVGHYVIMLSSDDLMKAGALKTYHQIISSENQFENNIVLHAAADHVDSDGRFKRLSYRFRENESLDNLSSYFVTDNNPLDGRQVRQTGHKLLRLSLLHAYSPATFCSTCYARQLWEKAGGYDVGYQYQPDTAFLFKILSLNPEVVYVNSSLFAYRIHGNNQNSNAIAKGAIKQQLDKYQMSYSISDSVLKRLQLERKDVEKAFLQEYCFKESLRTMRLGYKLRAFKIFSFAFSTYPARAFTSLWMYIALLANMVSFILVWVPGFRFKRITS